MENLLIHSQCLKMPHGRAPLPGWPADAAVQAGPGEEEGALCRKVLRDIRVARIQARGWPGPATKSCDFLNISSKES